MQKSKINSDLRFWSRLVELFFDYKIKGLLKPFVDIIYSITEFKMKVFVLSLKVLSPYNNKWVNASAFMDRRLGLKIVTLQQGLPFVIEIRAVEEVVLS